MIKFKKDTVQIEHEPGSSIELPNQVAWDLSEAIRTGFIEKRTISKDIPVATILKNGKQFTVKVTANYSFWSLVASGYWEPQTFRIFDKYLTQDTTYFDIGAFIGPTALYAAQLAKAAYAFEPDPIAFAELEFNVYSNRNFPWSSKLHIYPKAIASQNGKIIIGNQGSGGDSTSSVFSSDSPVKWEVDTVTLDEFIRSNNISGKMFIKMDIEGGEYNLIPTLKHLFKSKDIVLYISFHPQILKNSLDNKYRLFSRLYFFFFHFRLISSLPFRYFYSASGNRKNLFSLLLKALFKGKFISEFVATNARM